MLLLLMLLLLMFLVVIRVASASQRKKKERGEKKGNMNAHHLRNEFIEVAVFFPISKCLVQRFK